MVRRGTSARARATGEFLVFISQDAYPVATDWLARLTAPMRAEAMSSASTDVS